MLVLQLQDLVGEFLIVTHLAQVLVVGLREIRSDLVILRGHLVVPVLPLLGFAVLFAQKLLLLDLQLPLLFIQCLELDLELAHFDLRGLKALELLLLELDRLADLLP